MKIARLFAGAALATAAVSFPAKAQLMLQYSTTGCFYKGTTACTVGASSASILNSGLSFTGVTNGNLSVGPGGDKDINLGSFTFVGNQAFNFDPNGSSNDWGFRLWVSFISPITTPGGTDRIADFSGETSIDHTNDKLDIKFPDNSTTFTYAGGSFRLDVENVEDITWGDTKTLKGEIDCEKSDNDTCKPPTRVPEPTSFGLVAAGIAGIFAVARRRRNNA